MRNFFQKNNWIVYSFCVECFETLVATLADFLSLDNPLQGDIANIALLNNLYPDCAKFKKEAQGRLASSTANDKLDSNSNR